jgi:hypothetical protein
MDLVPRWLGLCMLQESPVLVLLYFERLALSLAKYFQVRYGVPDNAFFQFVLQICENVHQSPQRYYEGLG